MNTAFNRSKRKERSRGLLTTDDRPLPADHVLLCFPLPLETMHPFLYQQQDERNHHGRGQRNSRASETKWNNDYLSLITGH